MIHITTEDGRSLMYEFDEKILRLQFTQGLGEKKVSVDEIETGDWIRIFGQAKRRDREIDIAFVTKIQRIRRNGT